MSEELEKQIRFLEIKVSEQEKILQQIRSILSIPAGTSIIDSIKPVQIPEKKPPKNMRTGKKYSVEDRDYLKSILDYYTIHFDERDSTDRLIRILDREKDSTEMEVNHLSFLEKMLEKQSKLQ